MTRKAAVTQAQIERSLRAAREVFPGQPWRVRITAREVVIEPAGQPEEPEVDVEPEIVL